MKQLREFFDRYATVLNNADIELIAQMYTDQFMATSPDYCTCNKNDDEFRAVLASTAQIYKHIGMHAIRINTYIESLLDHHFHLVQIEWQLFREDGSELVAFDNTYLVRVTEGIPKIVLFIAHNEQQRLRAKGLVPG
jgi:hypothetical protein